MPRRAVRFEETDDLENSKVCAFCKKRLPIQAFHKDKSRSDGLQRRCRNCYRDWYNEHYAKSPEFREKRSDYFAKFYEEKYPTLREQKNATRFFRNYGITRQQFAEMSESQGNVCKICKQPPRGKTRLSVDHCHKTGLVRGLLCDPCNIGLGQFRDDPDLLAAAIIYLSGGAQPSLSQEAARILHP